MGKQNLPLFIAGRIFKDKGVSVAFNGSGFDVAINIR